MRTYDDDDIRNRIFEEFQKIDEFYDAFKDEFILSLCDIIKEYQPEFKPSKRFNKLFNEYAPSVLGVTQTVLDKDKAYPDYRKHDELLDMQTYLAKAVELSSNKDMAEKTHLKTKELLIKFYPQIVDLSSDGFRLLELNLRLFNLEFIANFNRLEEAED